MKNLIFFLAVSASLFLASCEGGGSAASSSSAFNVTGTIADAANLQMFFDKISFSNSSNVLQKVEIGSNGQFAIGLDEHPGEGVYRVRIGAKKGFLVLNGSETTIEINGALADFDSSSQKVTGSPSSSSYLAAEQKFVNNSLNVDNFGDFIGSNDGLVSSLLAVNKLGRSINAKTIAVLDKANAKLKADYPNSDYSTDFQGYVNDRVAKLEQLSIGQLIPIENRRAAQEVNLPSPNGKKYALSDLKGKVVLVDFWASWCRPCRAANPHVVGLYDKHNKEGFEIFSVSLDGDNKRWADAIKQDNLKWKYHVSDLKKWSSAPAKAWGVSSIPRTFVIDRDGKIAAINPNWRNGQLDQVLEQLLKQG